jgi:hypothetical protein
MLFPCALRFSFFIATGPMLARWSADGAVMMLSQMTAWLVALAPDPDPPADGHSAVTYTKRFLVFQVKSDERSASSENLIMAYSSFLEE